MIDHIISFLLMLTVPAQGFAVPHCHRGIGDAKPKGHDSRPHFHLGGGHHHGHSHGDGHSHHHHQPDQSDEEQGKTPDAPGPSDDHDNHAFYIAGELGLNPTQNASMVWTDGLIVWGLPATLTTVDACSFVEAAAHFSARGDTPIFLTTLSLRL